MENATETCQYDQTVLLIRIKLTADDTILSHHPGPGYRYSTGQHTVRKLMLFIAQDFGFSNNSEVGPFVNGINKMDKPKNTGTQKQQLSQGLHIDTCNRMKND